MGVLQAAELPWGKGSLCICCVHMLLSGQVEDSEQFFPMAGFGMELWAPSSHTGYEPPLLFRFWKAFLTNSLRSANVCVFAASAVKGAAYVPGTYG